MKMSLKKQFIFAFLLFGTVAIHSQTVREEGNMGALQDTTGITGEIEEVTVTAFRSPYNIFNIPAPVNLISSLKLETGSALTPVEALNQVPGIYMHHGTLNTNRLTIRGIGSRSPYATNKIKAYFGDIPLTSGDGETVLEDLENDAIKRVEIIKGPSSSLYGAGLAGVILFHPKNVLKDFMQNQTAVASFGTIKNSVSAGINQNKLNLFALGTVLKSNGFRENNETNRTNLLLHSQYSFSEHTNLQFLIRGTRMKAFIPSSLDLNTFVNRPEQAAANWGHIKGYEEYLNGQFGISLNVFTVRKEKISVAMFGNFKKGDELRPFNKLAENTRFLGWRGYAQKAVTGERWQLIFTSGLEFFRENYNWDTQSNVFPYSFLSDNGEKRSYENLFFQVESGFLESIFISAGINGNLTRFEYVDKYPEDNDQSGSRTYKPEISPRFGINALLLQNVSLFANISHGFSTPTFEETLQPEGVINPDIRPESGWSLESGIRARIGGRFQASASYYRIYIEDLLVARRTGEDAYVGVNAGSSLHPGLEAEISWSVTDPAVYPALFFSGNLTLANYHFREFIDNGVDYSGKNLPGTTKTTGMVAANLKTGKNTALNGWYRYAGKMPVNDANSDYADAYGITGIEFRHSGKISRLSFEIKGGVQNLFNVKYASMLAVNAPSFGGNPPRYYYPGEPRNFYAAVLVRFE